MDSSERKEVSQSDNKVLQCCHIFNEELSYKRSKIFVFWQRLSYIEFFTQCFTNFTKLTWRKKGLFCSNYRLAKMTIVLDIFRPKIIVRLSYYRISGNTEISILFSGSDKHYKSVRPSKHCYTKMSIYKVNLQFKYFRVLKSDFRLNIVQN